MIRAQQAQPNIRAAHHEPDPSAGVDRLTQQLEGEVNLPDESEMVEQGQEPQGGKIIPPMKRKVGRPKKRQDPTPAIGLPT